jgi:hypothetical protein
MSAGLPAGKPYCKELALPEPRFREVLEQVQASQLGSDQRESAGWEGVGGGRAGCSSSYRTFEVISQLKRTQSMQPWPIAKTGITCLTLQQQQHGAGFSVPMTPGETP